MHGKNQQNSPARQGNAETVYTLAIERLWHVMAGIDSACILDLVLTRCTPCI